MAILTKEGVISALARLGELAHARGEKIELLLFGGSVMVLVFETRQSTRDVDVMILPPNEPSKVRALANIVADELGWPHDWLNDAVKGFVAGVSSGVVIFSAPGLIVYRPAIEQLLAMKLSAWRDDVDIADARRLLQELTGVYDEVWKLVVQYVPPGRELKAKYAFDDLWDESHGVH